MMKTIVCFGDSNTWGFMPKTEGPAITADNRYPWGVRWTSLLQMKLGADYRVAEAGLNGRTTMFNCPMGDHRNGLAAIDTTMLCQMPVDLVTIMLGTNDVKDFFGVTPVVIARGALRLIENIRAGGYGPHGVCPEILLMAPIRLHPDMEKQWLGDEFGHDALKKDADLGRYLEKTAKEAGVHFLNAGEFITAHPADGIHMDENGHALLAEKVYEKITEILK